jgi:hypothetical protein
MLIAIGPLVPSTVKTLADFTAWCRGNPNRWLARLGPILVYDTLIGSGHPFAGALRHQTSRRAIWRHRRHTNLCAACFIDTHGYDFRDGQAPPDARKATVMPFARRSWKPFGEQERFMLLLIAPAALMLLLFQIVPIVIGANASFRDWTLNNPKKTWLGFAHYVYVITDPAFLQVALPNTFLFMLVSVSGALVIGLALAVLLNRRFRGQKLVQTVLLLPLMVAPVIAAIMIRWMFNDQFGIINVVIEALGFEGQPWLAQRWSAFGVILLTDPVAPA